MERVRTGVPGLDTLLHGGFTRGDAILVRGGPGAGKTGLGLQWVCRGAADYGEPGAIIVLEEAPNRFYRRAHAFGWDLRKLEEQNKVRTIFTSAEALSRDILTGSLLVGILAEIGACRVAIDPITHYRLAYQDSTQLRKQFSATINALKRLGQTALLVAEVGPGGWSNPAPEEYLADVIITLGDGAVEGRHFRRLEITKSSSPGSDPQSALFRILPSGMSVVTPFVAPFQQLSDASPTGLPALREELGGKPGRGTFFVVQLETELRRISVDLALMTLIGPIAEALVYLGNSSVNPSELWETAASTDFGRSLSGMASDRRMFFLDPFNRRRPLAIPPTCFRGLAGYDTDELISMFVGSESEAGLFLSLQEKTLVACNISDMFYHLGQTRFQSFLPQLVDTLKSRRISLVGVVDPRLMSPESHAWVNGMTDGIMRLWEAGGNRFAQVVKSPNGRPSAPRLLVETPEPPFIQFFD